MSNIITRYDAITIAGLIFVIAGIGIIPCAIVYLDTALTEAINSGMTVALIGLSVLGVNTGISVYRQALAMNLIPSTTAKTPVTPVTITAQENKTT